MMFLKKYWFCILVLLPTLTEWVDDGHFPTRLREVVTDVTITLLIGVFFWLIIREQKEIEKLTIIDKLTEIYNSRHFRTELDRLVSVSRRTSTPLSLIFIDVDNFKPVNDKYGHAAGDQILKLFAKALLASTRKDIDLCFRYGGDEFVVLCQYTGYPAIKEIAERILYSSRQILELQEKQITLSLGVAEFRSNQTPYEFLTYADQLMYAAKQSGKNRIQYGPNA